MTATSTPTQVPELTRTVKPDDDTTAYRGKANAGFVPTAKNAVVMRERVERAEPTITEPTVLTHSAWYAPPQQPTPPSWTVNRHIDYTYDGVYRLMGATYTEGGATTRTYIYDYDLLGNRMSAREQVGDAITLDTYTYDIGSRVATSQREYREMIGGVETVISSDPSYDYFYNNNGQIGVVSYMDGGQAVDVANYIYDAADQLVTFTDFENNDTYTFDYNGMGDRIQQTVNGTPIDYLLDVNSGLTQIVGEFAEGDETWYLLGMDVIGEQSGTNWGYYSYDGLGSVRQMTNVSGSVVYASNYDPYGQVIEQGGGLGTNLGFTGEYTDQSGLLYLRARYASTSLGRFLASDPVMGMVGGQSIRFNPYIYAGANPILYTDPSGEIFPLLIGAVIGAVAGGIGGAAFELGRQAINNISNGRPWNCNLDTDAILNAAAEGVITGAISGGLGMGFMGEFLLDTGWEMVVHGASLDEALTSALVGGVVGRGVEIGIGGIGRGVRASAGAAIGAAADGIRWAKNGGFGQIANSMGRRVRDAGDSIGRAWRGTDGSSGRVVSADDIEWMRRAAGNIDGNGRIRTARRAGAEAGVSLRQRRAWSAPESPDFRRFGSADEALRAQETNRLEFPTEGIGNRQQKWIADANAIGERASFGDNRHYTHRMDITTSGDAVDWLERNAVDYDDWRNAIDEGLDFVPGTDRRGSNVSVLTKRNEPGWYGLTSHGLGLFNRNITNITATKIR